MTVKATIRERELFEEWYVTHVFDLEQAPIGSRDCGLQWQAWHARAYLAALPAAAPREEAAKDMTPIEAQHDETGRIWHGARGDLPRRFHEVQTTDAAPAPLLGPPREQSCKTDPRAPHSFLRNASHSEGRYVCECEFWEPETADQGASVIAPKPTAADVGAPAIESDITAAREGSGLSMPLRLAHALSAIDELLAERHGKNRKDVG